ncbi:MAG: hypothetical protein Q9159_003346 [Coniocarpon cinnabarinum]
MAEVTSVPGVKADILINDAPTTLYNDEDHETSHSSVSKYIQSQSDACWAVKLSISRKGWRVDHVDLRIWSDGELLASRFVDMSRPGSQNRWVFDGQRCKAGGASYKRLFRFGKLETTEGPLTTQVKQLLPKISQLGVIKIELWRCQRQGSSYPDRTWTSHDSLSETSPLPEKALKGRALSHRVNLGERVATSPEQKVPVSYLDDRPHATFVFKYLSKESLQAMMIAPRSPTPVTPNAADEIDTLTPQELRARLRAAQADERNSKEQPKRKVKLEQTNGDELEVTSSRRLKKAKIETVDLTSME